MDANSSVLEAGTSIAEDADGLKLRIATTVKSVHFVNYRQVSCGRCRGTHWKTRFFEDRQLLDSGSSVSPEVVEMKHAVALPTVWVAPQTLAVTAPRVEVAKTWLAVA